MLPVTRGAARLMTLARTLPARSASMPMPRRWKALPRSNSRSIFRGSDGASLLPLTSLPSTTTSLLCVGVSCGASSISARLALNLPSKLKRLSLRTRVLLPDKTRVRSGRDSACRRSASSFSSRLASPFAKRTQPSACTLPSPPSKLRRCSCS
ncbi:hypothetical protein D3C72_1602950 [compost metagenome]